MNIIQIIINAIKRFFGFGEDKPNLTLVPIDGGLNLVIEDETVITEEKEDKPKKAKKVTKKKSASKKKSSKKKSSKKKEK